MQLSTFNAVLSGKNCSIIADLLLDSSSLISSFSSPGISSNGPSFLSSPPGDKKSPSCVCIFSFNCIKFPAVTDSALLL
ncbi:MAG: hypothetical protein IPK25_16425 [Saprospiraceae bacterium]|nr:hypothetical protein [Saprospiraceae bacterium]